VVRIILTDQAVVFLTHETIPGLMAGTTRAFTAASPRLLRELSAGDPVRFTLERRSGQLLLVAIERDKTP
jgi:Cu/Ag efflux protein CusF